MNKSQFLFELERGLYGISETSRQKIITHYDKVLTRKIQNGMSEESAVASLGDVNKIIQRAMGIKSSVENGRFKEPFNQLSAMINGKGQRANISSVFPKIIQAFVVYTILKVVLGIITTVLANLAYDSEVFSIAHVLVSGVLGVALNVGFIVYLIVTVTGTLKNVGHMTNEVNCNQHLTHQGVGSGRNSDIRHGQSSFECNEHLSHEKRSFSFFKSRNDIDSLYESTTKDSGVRDFEQEFLGSTSSNYGFNQTSSATSQYSDSVSDDPSFQFAGNGNAFDGVANIGSIVSKVFKVIFTVLGIIGVVIGGICIAFLVNLSINNINFPGLYIVACAQIVFSTAFFTASGKGKHKILKVIGKVVLSAILTFAGVVVLGVQLSEMQPIAMSVEEFLSGYDDFETKLIEYDFNMENGLRLPSSYVTYEFEVDESLPDGKLEMEVPEYFDLYTYDYSQYYSTDLEFEVRLQDNMESIKHFIELQLDGIKNNEIYYVDEDLTSGDFKANVKISGNAETIRSLKIVNE